LGWSTPDSSTNMLTLPQLIEQFSLESVRTADSMVDPNLLLTLNAQHIQQQTGQALVQHIKPRLINSEYWRKQQPAIQVSDQFLAKFCNAIKANAITLNSFSDEEWSYFFVEPDLTTPTAVQFAHDIWPSGDTAQSVPLLEATIESIQSLPEPDFENIAVLDGKLRNVARRFRVKAKQYFEPLRFYLSGRPSGTTVLETMVTIGKTATIRRLTNALNYK